MPILNPVIFDAYVITDALNPVIFDVSATNNTPWRAKDNHLFNKENFSLFRAFLFGLIVITILFQLPLQGPHANPQHICGFCATPVKPR